MQLVMKSREACISAVETYNRASTMYREETFAILMINAWELLLKARIVRERGGKVSSLWELQPRRKKDGEASKLKEYKRNRSGTPLTIGLERAYNLVAGFAQHRIDQNCIANIEALVGIRDNATHFVVHDAALRKSLTEIALASVRNYVLAAQEWFNVSFSDLNIASMPITFDLDHKQVESVAHKQPEAVTRFLAYMEELQARARAESSDFSVSIRVNFDVVKNRENAAVTAALVRDDPDLTVTIDGDKLPAGFNTSYRELLARLSARYIDFSQNGTFHDIMKRLKKDERYCYNRYPDPEKKAGTPKQFYNLNILRELDCHYERRGKTLFETPDEEGAGGVAHHPPVA
ncbi:DUF3644 domain-containing protein [Sphingomonadaceae bacterium OTU29LAMAA1]|nr:DUF3644 domain-containing protein [Sphingomonadaceae bacterium OTU29LAMAA1]